MDGKTWVFYVKDDLENLGFFIAPIFALKMTFAKIALEDFFFLYAFCIIYLSFQMSELIYIHFD